MRKTTFALAATLALAGSLSTESPLAQDGGQIKVPPGTDVRVTIGSKTSAPAKAMPRKPKIAGVVVLEDQIFEPNSETLDLYRLNTKYPYPHDPNVNEFGGTRTTERTLFIWGEGLPSEAEAVLLESPVPQIAYRRNPRPALGSAERVAWQKIAKFDKDAADHRQRYSFIVVVAKLAEGVTPGAKDILVDGARVTWPLLFADQTAVMRFVRESGEAQYNPTDIFYTQDLGFLELVYQRDMPFTEISVELQLKKQGSADVESLGLLTARPIADRQRPTFRTEPIQFFDPAEPPAGAAGALVRVGVRKGDQVSAKLFDKFEAMAVPVVSTATIASKPEDLGSSWKAALETVRACYKEPGREVTGGYDREPATKVSYFILSALERLDVQLKKGDHAAAILIRDEFVRMSETLLAEYAAMARDPKRPAESRAQVSQIIDVEKTKAAVKRARDTDPCNLNELLVLAGQEAPAVVARILQRLVKRDESAQPPRWVPDVVAQRWVKGLHTAGAAVRALKEYATVDDSFKALALAVGTAGLAKGLALGGYAASAAWALVAGDVADLAIFGSMGVAQYIGGENRYAYARGATPVFGSDAFLEDAEEARQTWQLTALGLIAPGVSGAIGVKELRNVRAIQRGRALIRAGDRSLDDLARFTEVERKDLAAYYRDMYRRGGKNLSKLDDVDRAAFGKFNDYFEKKGVPTASVGVPNLPGSSTTPQFQIPSTPKPQRPSPDELVIEFNSSELNAISSRPGSSSAIGSGSSAPGLEVPVDFGLSLPTGTAVVGDSKTIAALHSARLDQNPRLAAGAPIRSTEYHVAPPYTKQVEFRDLTGRSFTVDGELYTRGDMLNPIPDIDPGHGRTAGNNADVYDVRNAKGGEAPFVTKTFGERAPWEDLIDPRTGRPIRGREPSLSSARAEDIEMADDIEYGAGLLHRSGTPQAELYHVEHRGPHPVILQRRLDHNRPPGVAREETWQQAALRKGLPEDNLWATWGSDAFKDERMAVLEMRKKMADAGLGWEDGHPGNFFLQRTDDGRVQAAIWDQDRIDYVREFAANRRPRPARMSTYALDHVENIWNDAVASLPQGRAPRPVARGNAHEMAIASLWGKGAFSIDSSGRLRDGWLKVDEIRKVFGEDFRRLLNERPGPVARVIPAPWSDDQAFVAGRHILSERRIHEILARVRSQFVGGRP